jgi:hypothetical protein
MGAEIIPFDRNLLVLSDLCQQQNVMVLNNAFNRIDAIRKLINTNKGINVKDECNYPDELTIDDYKATYLRDGIGTRVVNFFPQECWVSDPDIYQIEDETKVTRFERELGDLAIKFNLYSMLERLDESSGIGRIGVLFVGLDDGRALNQPVENVNDDDTPKVKYRKKPINNITFLRVLDESEVSVVELEDNQRNLRYGQPVMYRIKLVPIEEFNNSGSNLIGGTSTLSPSDEYVDVHWTRIIPMAHNKRSSAFIGTPEMENVYNWIFNLQKILGADGEGFWRSGFPGISIESQPNSGAIGDLESQVDEIRSQLRRYQRGLDRTLIFDGMTAKTLTPAITDPTSHVNVQMQMITATKGFPYRIFMGSEEAKLAAEQDKDNWGNRCDRRKNKICTPDILRPVVNRFMAYGALPWVGKYFVEWQPTNSSKREKKVDISSKIIVALSNYVKFGISAIMDPEEFLMMFGYSAKESKRIVAKAQLGGILKPKVELPKAPVDSTKKKGQSSDKRSKQAR